LALLFACRGDASHIDGGPRTASGPLAPTGAGGGGNMSGTLTSGTVPVASGAHGLQNGSWSDTLTALSTSSSVTVNSLVTIQNLQNTDEQLYTASTVENDLNPTSWGSYMHWHITPA